MALASDAHACTFCEDNLWRFAAVLSSFFFLPTVDNLREMFTVWPGSRFPLSCHSASSCEGGKKRVGERERKSVRRRKREMFFRSFFRLKQKKKENKKAKLRRGRTRRSWTSLFPWISAPASCNNTTSVCLKKQAHESAKCSSVLY